MHPFRAAVEARDLEAIPALLAPDAVFVSPVAFRPYEGRELVSAILVGVGRVLEDLVYVREYATGDGDGLALLFTARVDDRDVQGCDFLRFDAAGRITELMVMLRPLRAAEAVARRMGEQFEAIQADAVRRMAAAG
jgi:hypothetical protein